MTQSQILGAVLIAIGLIDILREKGFTGALDAVRSVAVGNFVQVQRQDVILGVKLPDFDR